MPALVEVTISAITDVPLFLPASGRAAQSLFLNALTLYDPDLSDRVKFGREGAPPYSVGRILVPPELLRPQTSGGYVVLPAGGRAKFYLGLAADELVEPTLKALQGEFRLAQADVKVESSVRRSERYEELLGSQPARLISFRTRNPLVLGPASFGKRSFQRWDPWKSPLNPAHLLLLPFRAWNAYAPEPIRMPETILGSLERLEVVRVDLEWRGSRIPLEGKWRTIPGYLGQIEVSPAGLDTFTGSMVAALARLAEYTGLGSRTTEGFGSVSVKFL